MGRFPFRPPPPRPPPAHQLFEDTRCVSHPCGQSAPLWHNCVGAVRRSLASSDQCCVLHPLCQFKGLRRSLDRDHPHPVISVQVSFGAPRLPITQLPSPVEQRFLGSPHSPVLSCSGRTFCATFHVFSAKRRLINCALEEYIKNTLHRCALKIHFCNLVRFHLNNVF